MLQASATALLLLQLWASVATALTAAAYAASAASPPALIASWLTALRAACSRSCVLLSCDVTGPMAAAAAGVAVAGGWGCAGSREQP